MSFPACGEASDMELVTTRVLNRVLMAYLHQGVPRMSAPRPSLLGRVWRWVASPEKDAAADVRVGVGRAVVVHVEQPVVPVLVIVPAEVQTRVGRIEVPVIRRTRKQGTDCVRRHPLYFQAAYAAENPL